MTEPLVDTLITDRITRLEVQLETNSKRLEDIGTKVNELHEVLMQAKGAKYMAWALLALTSLMGAKFMGLLASFGDKLPK